MAYNYRFPYMTVTDARTAEMWSEKAMKPRTTGFIFYKDSSTQTHLPIDPSEPVNRNNLGASRHEASYDGSPVMTQTDSPPRHSQSSSQSTFSPQRTRQVGKITQYQATSSESPGSVSFDVPPRSHDHVRAIGEKDDIIAMLKKKLVQLYVKDEQEGRDPQGPHVEGDGWYDMEDYLSI